MTERWVEIFKCVMFVRNRPVVDDSQIGDVKQEGEEELRKKREREKKKKLGRHVIWAVGVA